MLTDLASKIRQEGRAMHHLSKQHRAILHALRDGMELTTLTAVLMERPICALSQRSGELARKGLVTRELVEVRNLDGRPMKVLRVQLTDAGRAVDLDPDPAPPTRNELPHAVIVKDRRGVEDLFEGKGLSRG
jgi:hypothetical protein